MKFLIFVSEVRMEGLPVKISTTVNLDVCYVLHVNFLNAKDEIKQEKKEMSLFAYDQ